MKSIDVKDLRQKLEDYMGKEIRLQGWIRNHRKQKEFGFIDFYDGTCFGSVQLVYDNTLESFEQIQKYRVGSSIEVLGTVEKSPAKGQTFEIKVSTLTLLGDSPEDYPIQPKRHTREFLREVGYLRPRVNLFQAVFRVRSVVAMAIHTYFQENGYIYFHAPLITASDCEGAGEMFQVTTLDLEKLPKTEDDKIDFHQDFFGKPASLTVSGQLQAEAFAMAFKRVYTFGPTFRAENSNTKTHASEFWMIEPEIAFCDLDGVMDIEEDMLKFIIRYVLEHCEEEMKFFDSFVEKGIIQKLKDVVDAKAARITHKEAIDILLASGEKFENKPTYGEDLATEHEKYLTGVHFKSPVFVTDWPKDIKAFYMRQNDDGQTVAAVDLLVPGAGELMGGSQREERLDRLESRMKELNMETEGMEWYLNLRRYGGCKHSGFGMGFERLLIYMTGVENIRDVIPFPRTPGNCEF
ncbi:MAG TPA: asparagine--tRNA ligase [Candidatus Fimihabitans intestinipullorum]|uniref:Asparagine--tRNA ligase n=1 Tax=Candidatus Fimihabitans intestinipullorum TaxID=2840820 RepID=A0A9D1HTI8_9BACT|nr:asparagine--tRNA ligase [Candidatus Fimihabitans intestinipullorum]